MHPKLGRDLRHALYRLPALCEFPAHPRHSATVARDWFGRHDPLIKSGGWPFTIPFGISAKTHI
jgi:hypothetical protein